MDDVYCIHIFYMYSSASANWIPIRVTATDALLVTLLSVL
jgi:hypothetical protein